MNKIILYSLILIMSGCVVSGSLPRLSENPEKSLVDGKGDFVELFDGTIIQGNISAERNKNIVIDGNTYHVKGIKSYQYKSQYRTTVKNRFVTRVVKGKINIFRQTINSPGDMFGSTSSSRAGSSIVYYYIQKGENGIIESFDVKTLEAMVSDNPKALEWVIKYKSLKKKLDFYLDNAIETYNTI